MTVPPMTLLVIIQDSLTERQILSLSTNRKKKNKKQTNSSTFIKVIGRRSFGTNCRTVSDMALAELNGLKRQGITGVYKHFPGHGATEADTHEGYAYTNATLEEMLDNDLVPFTDGIQNGVAVIMVAHIACPNVTGDDTPASLSSVMITDILRDKLDYNGTISEARIDASVQRIIALKMNL